jgi:hypothetical protein
MVDPKETTTPQASNDSATVSAEFCWDSPQGWDRSDWSADS